MRERPPASGPMIHTEEPEDGDLVRQLALALAQVSGRPPDRIEVFLWQALKDLSASDLTPGEIDALQGGIRTQMIRLLSGNH
ncbi:hypothetical protein [Iodidimonas sp. SYSU 1G8]|uniref:hypothetical protein n=1 Tax=Iodidimonas sp. SYSU 1G8 TaxID=3133967 RepID=UPI0031FF25F8